MHLVPEPLLTSTGSSASTGLLRGSKAAYVSKGKPGRTTGSFCCGQCEGREKIWSEWHRIQHRLIQLFKPGCFHHGRSLNTVAREAEEMAHIGKNYSQV